MAGSRSAILYADGGRAAALGGGSPDDPGVLGGMVIALQSNVVALQGQNGAFNSTFAQASSVYIDASVKAFRTLGRNQAGDGGDAMYKRRSTPPPAMGTFSNDGGTTVQSYTWNTTVYFQSADRFKDDGTYDFANGGWWELSRMFEVDTRIFGAVCTGLDGAGNDDRQASQDALDWISTRGVALDRCGRIRIHGYSTHGATLYVRAPLVGICGDGARQSMIRVNGDIGDIVFVRADNSMTSQGGGFTIKDISIRQYYANTTNGACLHLQRVIGAWATDCQFSNHFGGVLIEGGQILNFNGVNIRTGVLWSGTKAGSYLFQTMPGIGWPNANIPIEIYAVNCSWDSDATAGVPGTGNCDKGLYYRAGDGTWISNTHVFGCATADCYIQPYQYTVAGVVKYAQCDGLRCNQIWFDNNAGGGVLITGTTTDPTVPFGDFQFTGCKFLGNSYGGYNFRIDDSCNVQTVGISGSNFDNAGLSNIRIGGGSNITVTGCNIVGAGTQGTSDAYGIAIVGTPQNITITGNTFVGTSPRQTAPIFMQGGSPNYVTISGNTFRGGVWGVRDFTRTKDKFIGNNVETNTFWQNALQLNQILQVPAGGDYVEAASSVNGITDIGVAGVTLSGVAVGGTWNKRKLRVAWNSTVVVQHDASKTAGMFLKAGTATTYHAGDLTEFFYNGTYWREV